MMDLSGAEWLWGRRVILETIAARRRRVLQLCLNRSAHGGEIEQIKEEADAVGFPIVYKSESELLALARGGNHQGVVAAVGSYPYVPVESLMEGSGGSGGHEIIVVLDHIQDPQNLGSILRTGECAGLAGVIIPKDRAAGVTPAVVRASSGASEHIRVARVINLARAVRELREGGRRIVGLDTALDSVSLMSSDLTGSIVLVIGGEEKGITRLVRELCDFLVAIPMYGKIESLNAGVAFGIAVYEARRQHGERCGR